MTGFSNSDTCSAGIVSFAIAKKVSTAFSSFRVTGYPSRRSTIAVQPCAAATDVTISRNRFFAISPVSFSKYRIVPTNATSSGITLCAVPLWNFVIETTSASRGSVFLETSCCNEVITFAAHRIGSQQNCGNAAWPPVPRMVTETPMSAASIGPGFVATWWRGSWGQPCKPNIMPTFGPSTVPSRQPSSTICWPPPPPSSAGWKTNETGLGKVCSLASCARTFAAPSNIVVCPSCPHACIHPWCVDFQSKVFSSTIGRASMSARSPMAVLLFPLRCASTPVPFANPALNGMFCCSRKS